MLLDADLLPFAARRQFDRLPEALQDKLLDPQSRPVLRDWARERAMVELDRALEPRRFHLHAVEVLVNRYVHTAEVGWSVSVRWDTSGSAILLVQRGQSPVQSSIEEVERWTDGLLRGTAEAFWRLGLEGSGRDAVEREPSSEVPELFVWDRTTGFVSRLGEW